MLREIFTLVEINDLHASICSSAAGVLPLDIRGALSTMGYGLGMTAMPSTCLYNPFDPIAFWIHGA
jgi:hypothetical protein